MSCLWRYLVQAVERFSAGIPSLSTKRKWQNMFEKKKMLSKMFTRCDKGHEMVLLLCHRDGTADSGFIGSDLLGSKAGTAGHQRRPSKGQVPEGDRAPV